MTAPDIEIPDIEALCRMARDKSSAGRKALVDVIGDLFFGGRRVLSEQERSIMIEILRRLVRDVEMAVRAGVARGLSDHDDVAQELVSQLAGDDVEAAYPILVHSTLLQDERLIELVRHRALQHQLAAAMRGRLSKSMAEEVRSADDWAEIRRLLQARGTHLSQPLFERRKKGPRTESPPPPLLGRAELGADLARRMTCWVSAALRRDILSKHDIDVRALDDGMSAVIEALSAKARLTSDADGGRAPSGEPERRPTADALSPRFLIELLREGQIGLFEGLFAEMTGLRLTLIRRFVYEPGGEALAIACKAVQLSKPDFASIFMLSRQARPRHKTLAPNELNRALEIFDRIDLDIAGGVVRRWRLNPDYLHAIKELDDVDQQLQLELGIGAAAGA